MHQAGCLVIIEHCVGAKDVSSRCVCSARAPRHQSRVLFGSDSDVTQLPHRSWWVGAGIPPRYGDCEAQRHWMEITINLPVAEW